MGFSFPRNPILNQTFTPIAGTTYTYNGTAWELPAISLDSITLGGDAQAVTAALGDRDTSIATTAFVQAALATTPPNCGRLSYVSATQVKFAPFNGDKIKINGKLYTIPPGGVLANNNNTSANMNFYVYVYDGAGVLMIFFEAISSGSVSHRPSQTAGNEGVEVRFTSSTEFPLYTLIGMVRMNASNQFVDNDHNRFVLSWYNRRTIQIYGGQCNGNQTAYTGGYIELNGSVRMNFLTWADESVYLHAGGFSIMDTQGQHAYGSIGFDSTSSGSYPLHHTPFFAGWYGCTSIGWGIAAPTEGFHYATPIAYVTGGTGTYYITLCGQIRG